MLKSKSAETIKNEMKRLNEIKSLPPNEYTDAIRAEQKEIEKFLDELQDIYDGFGEATKNSDIPIALRILGDESRENTDRDNGYILRSPNDPKTYRSLFGHDGKKIEWKDKKQPYFWTIFSGRPHEELRSMAEGVPSSGGFWVPSEYTEQIHSVALENEIIMPRCFVQPMQNKEIVIPAMEIGDHSNSLWGGFTASYSAEQGTLTENNPKARQLELVAKKLYGFLKVSNELFNDVANFENQIISLCGKGLAWYRDYYFINGNGAGQAQGLLNAPCKIEVAKESGQAVNTVVLGNLLKMEERMHPGGLLNAVWIANQTLYNQLRVMAYEVGTGGDAVRALERKGNQFYLLDRLLFFTEKNPSIGNSGDIILADLSQYVVGLREGMQIALSQHVYFTTDCMAARIIERHDGQSLWNEAMTLKDGSTTVSPIVTIADRIS